MFSSFIIFILLESLTSSQLYVKTEEVAIFFISFHVILIFFSSAKRKKSLQVVSCFNVQVSCCICLHHIRLILLKKLIGLYLLKWKPFHIFKLLYNLTHASIITLFLFTFSILKNETINIKYVWFCNGIILPWNYIIVKALLSDFLHSTVCDYYLLFMLNKNVNNSIFILII